MDNKNSSPISTNKIKTEGEAEVALPMAKQLEIVSALQDEEITITINIILIKNAIPSLLPESAARSACPII